MAAPLWDRLRGRLGIGEPRGLDRSAAEIAERELAEADVDLETWRHARDGARDDAQACQRYVRLRVAQLRREATVGAHPLRAADLEDRRDQAEALVQRIAEHHVTPDGQREYQDTLRAALRGLWGITAAYFAAALLILALFLWIAA